MAYRYKFKDDLQWQYTCNKSQAHRLAVVEQRNTTPQPTKPAPAAVAGPSDSEIGALVASIGPTEGIRRDSRDLTVDKLRVLVRRALATWGHVKAAPVSQGDAVAEVVIESDCWSRGHFYEGKRKTIRKLGSLKNLPIGTRLVPENAVSQPPENIITALAEKYGRIVIERRYVNHKNKIRWIVECGCFINYSEGSTLQEAIEAACQKFLES